MQNIKNQPIMTIDNMIPGSVYTLIFNDGDKYIVEFEGLSGEEDNDIDVANHMCPNNEVYYTGDSLCSSSLSTVREASTAEIAHLQACIEEGEYVSAPEIDNYQIY